MPDPAPAPAQAFRQAPVLGQPSRMAPPSLPTVSCHLLQVSPTGAAARDGRLKVGMRILEVNHQSLLGMTHGEAVQILRAVGDTLLVLVCDGFDPKAVTAIEVGDVPRLLAALDCGFRRAFSWLCFYLWSEEEEEEVFMCY